MNRVAKTSKHQSKTRCIVTSKIIIIKSVLLTPNGRTITMVVPVSDQMGVPVRPLGRVSETITWSCLCYEPGVVVASMVVAGTQQTPSPTQCAPAHHSSDAIAMVVLIPGISLPREVRNTGGFLKH